VDPLTHGLLGAACGQAVFGRALGRRALAWGALAGMAPDVDVVMNLTGPMAEWTWHRGLTHALWFGPAVGAALAVWLRRRFGGRWRDWAGLVALATTAHALLDAFTSYGTQLLAPFSHQRFAWNGVAIVDPACTLALAAALVVAWTAGTGARRARRAAAAALLFVTGYLGLGVWLNARVERAARAQLAAAGARVERVSAYPTLLQLPLRRVVARGEGFVRVGWSNAFAGRPIAWEAFEEARGPLVDAARGAREARLFEWFAMGEVAARLAGENDGVTAVELDDLRYGVPGSPRDGLWGVRVRLDAEGRVLGGERIDRPLPRGGAELLRELWKRTVSSG
jgi:inner membrane protein